ncbi:major capsid protein [Metasolibacillus meyeri]|uniref:major capsid protein n=1 Tax=Metasolibacillus meyeri TaxID=1071052 RepID=UPI000D302102|nr:major capsid protein [Metasolibacillus meyeri]
MPKLFEYVSPKNIADFIVTKNTNKMPYLGEILFPSEQQLGLKLEWLKSAQGLPVVLKPSAFDALAPLRDRVGFEKIEEEMPFFRERMLIKEVDRQQLNTLLMTGNQKMIDFALKTVFDDAYSLTTGASAARERMRMQLLSTGKISIAAEGAYHDFNYNLKPTQFETLTGTDIWSDEDSTPVQDLLRWKREVRLATGSEPTGAIMTSVTFGYLLAHKSIALDLNPLGGQNIILTEQDVKAYIERKTGLKIALYDNRFIDEKGVQKNFFPDGVVTLIPSGELGKTMFGTTPEQSDLMSGVSSAEVEIVDTGVAITTVKVEHPVNVQTIVSQIALPSFEAADFIFIANVL